MAFIFTCGTHAFTSRLAGYEHINNIPCWRCHNHSAAIVKRWEWFTFCFVPIIPFSFKPWHEVACPVCGDHPDISHRPDVQRLMNGESMQAVYGQGQAPQQHPQGPQQQQPPQYQHPQGQGGMQYR